MVDLTTEPYSLPTIQDVLRWRAQAHPDRTLYTFIGADGEPAGTLTYGELYRQADAVAKAPQGNAAPRDGQPACALLMYSPGLEFVAGFFGCLYAGVIAVPIYPPKSSRHMERFVAVVRDSSAIIGLTSNNDADKVHRFFAGEESRKGVSILATDNLARSARTACPQRRPDPHNIAMLQYTSGSTSDPKGVSLTHANIMAHEFDCCIAAGHDEQTVICGWLPTFHDFGLFGGLLQTLFVGGSSHFMAPTTFLQNPMRWFETVKRSRATVIGAPNFGYALATRTDENCKPELSTIQVAWNGGEPIRAEILESFDSTFADCGWRPEAHMPCYGLAESVAMVASHRTGIRPRVLTVDSRELEQGRVVAAAPGDAGGTNRLVSCGTTHGQGRVVIVDPTTCKLRGEREIGEIWIQGPSVAAGYWNKPQETEETFRACIHGEPGFWLRSGDLGFLDNGDLFVTGRFIAHRADDRARFIVGGKDVAMGVQRLLDALSLVIGMQLNPLHFLVIDLVAKVVDGFALFG